MQAFLLISYSFGSISIDGIAVADSVVIEYAITTKVLVELGLSRNGEPVHILSYPTWWTRNLGTTTPTLTFQEP